MANRRTLFFIHLPFAFDRQLLLAYLIGDLPWAYDLQTCILSFGDCYQWKAEIIGTESEETGTWFWAWANEASNIPPEQQAASLKLKALGEEHGIAELTEAMVPLDHADGHAFASIAVGEGLGKAYYRGPYEGGTIFFLITDERLQFDVQEPVHRILTVFPQAISAMEVPNHREAFRSYLNHYGFEPEDRDSALLLQEEGTELLRAEFDDLDRLIQLRGELGQKPDAKHRSAENVADHPFGTAIFEVVENIPEELELYADEVKMPNPHAEIEQPVDESPESTPFDDWAQRLTPVMQQALAAEDLTILALSDRLPPAIGRSFSEGDVYEKIARSLFRFEAKHVVLTGDRGVGKTTVLRELARRAAEGQFPLLADRRFLRLDCSSVPPEEGRAVLERIVREVGDWENLVLCLDGLGPLLKRSADNKAFLRAVLTRSGLQMIGTLTTWEYQDLLGGDAEFSDLITRIEIEEPGEEDSLAILESKREQLEREHRVVIPPEVLPRAIALASAYVLSERHPAKGLKLLRRACENVNYARTQHDADENRVTTEEVVQVAAELTGVPLETLSGSGGTADYQAALTASVVGQPDAVEVVATELKLIKAGLTEPDRPASVLLFAGMTGVGKTELAKALARLYSATGRLQVYSMGNFTEPHTVSGIIGVPPGYVGHDQGGRLINELNADPYAVFLLDEAEKAHPNVWKPFLNLFDEGWIVYQRGVKAHADRAIFILTTNAGDQQIAQMSQQGKSEEEIIARVKQTLSKIRHERSTQPVFAPQFLARLQRILIFRPLDEAAMTGIARLQVEKMQTTWKRKREKTLIVPDTLIEHIGQRGHELNQTAKGQEGGRIIRKLLVDLVETPIQKAVTERPAEYKACTQISVSLAAADSVDRIEAAVSFD